MMVFKPIGSSQKSFYGKAEVRRDGTGVDYLVSYGTTVAKIDGGKFIRLWDGWSATTQRHINSFRALNDMESITKKQWVEMPVEV